MEQTLLSFKKNIILIFLLWITFIERQTNHIRVSASDDVGSSYFFYQQPQYPRDCYEIFNQCSEDRSSGVYLIKPDGYSYAFEVFCDNENDGGGWTTFHRRTEGAIGFDRVWKEYKNGFGFLSSEFWLGLQKLSFLTNQKKYEIRIDLKNRDGLYFYSQYNLFHISDEWSDFRLTGLGDYNGTAGNFTEFCPPNMEYGNCTCQATCEDSGNLMRCQTTCTEEETCICQEGFVKRGDDCVLPEECSCFMEGEGIIPNGQTQINTLCTRRCECQSNVLTCEDNYRCSSHATCEERGGVRQCYCNDGYTGDGETCVSTIPTDCADIYSGGVTDSSVYTIKPTNWPGPSFQVYCNMTDGGGWTVFQRRVDGSEDFYRGWNSYKDGFGSPNHEVWLGNDKIYYLTNQRDYQLRIDLVDRNGSPFYAKYNLFRISDENDKYKMVELGSSSGNTGGYNAMSWHKNKPFSTYDRDNDGWNDYNCAQRHKGAWWYAYYFFSSSNSICRTGEDYCDYWPEGPGCGVCDNSNLNSDYDSTTRGNNIHWTHLSGYDCNIIYTEMKIKPV